MSDPATPYQTLARNERNWHILGLADGSIQCDFGPFAAAFSPSEFQIIGRMLEYALALPRSTGRLASAGPERGIWYYSHNDTFVLIINWMVLRFRSHELVAFLELCQAANAVLGCARAPYTPPPDAAKWN